MYPNNGNRLPFPTLSIVLISYCIKLGEYVFMLIRDFLAYQMARISNISTNPTSQFFADSCDFSPIP